MILPVWGPDFARIGVWYCVFEVLKQTISRAQMVLFVRWKSSLKCKLLVSSRLYKTFIFRLFSSKRESACKFSFIFWGRTENSNWKNAGYWKYVTHPFEFPLCWRQQRRYGIDAAVFYYYQSSLNIGMTTSYVILRWFINRNLSSLSSTGNLVERKNIFSYWYGCFVINNKRICMITAYPLYILRDSNPRPTD